jgi:hypothetical protein
LTLLLRQEEGGIPQRKIEVQLLKSGEKEAKQAKTQCPCSKELIVVALLCITVRDILVPK